MENENIIQVFEQFGILKEEYPPYSDPYTFAKQIAKVTLLQADQICYTNSTQSLQKV